MTMPKGWSSKKGSDGYERSTSPSFETVLWYREHKKGVFKRKVQAVDKITTQGVSMITYNEGGNVDTERKFFFHEIQDIVVMNQHRAFSAMHSGVYSGRSGYGYTAGQSTGASKTVGDVVFYAEGGNTMIFRGIHDPNGLKALARAAKNDKGGY